MQEIYVEDISKVLSDKKKLESELEVKITNKGKNIFVNGSPEKEFIAIEVLKAINLGFSANCALQLKDEEIILQISNIKGLTKRKDLETIRARIIGTQGKTLKTLHNLTDCHISLKDNTIGIIGNCENIKDAIQSIESLVHGSRQGNVYGRLEKQKKRKRIQEKINLK